MSGMPAAVYTGDGNVAVETLPIPEPVAGEALVEVSHCGICGTDLHLVLEQYARPGSVLGHEWAGTRGCGRRRRRGLRRSARAWWPNPHPDAARAERAGAGRPSVCLREPRPITSTFARRVLSLRRRRRSARLLRFPSALTTRAAALTEPTAIAIHTVNLSGVEPSDRVLVTGAGPVGSAHDGSATRPRRRRHHRVGAERGPPRACARRSARSMWSRPMPCQAHRWAAASPSRTRVAFECSGHATCRRSCARSARLRRHARVRRHGS